MKKILVLFSSLAFVAFLNAGCGEKGVFPAEPFAEPDNARARFSDGILRMIEAELDLSESQKIAFKKLADELAAEIAAKRQTRKADMQSFANAFKGASISETEIDKIASHFALKDRHVSMQAKLIQAHQILSPEQRAKLADKLQARLDEMSQKRAKWAERGKDKPRDLMRGFALKKIARDLDLSESQQETLAQIVSDFQSKIPVEDEPAERAQMQTFIREFRKDKIDETALNQASARLDAKQATMRSAMKNAIGAFHAMLTPEQRAKASEKMSQMAERLAKFRDGEPWGRGKHWGKEHCR
ncbi:MAG: Spy/CpxP family protein refolding chaperone [Chloroherpetonaceae bacterium]|nr:Spy/CpxP family protein refolding chaperone [Chloroherpetonaceae bacterium]